MFKKKSNILLKMYFSICLMLFSVGCLSNIVSIDEHTKYWVGHHIEEKKAVVNDSHSYASRSGWKERTYQLGNGNWVYVQPDSPNCIIHWEVNPQGIIVGYKLEGKCY